MTTVGAVAGSFLHKVLPAGAAAAADAAVLQVSPSLVSTWLFVIVISAVTFNVVRRLVHSPILLSVCC